jgi:uncharacterized cupredoxin-like copper-binding protein
MVEWLARTPSGAMVCHLQHGRTVVRLKGRAPVGHAEDASARWRVAAVGPGLGHACAVVARRSEMGSRMGIALLPLVLMLGACGSGTGSATSSIAPSAVASAANAGTTVSVQLQEWAVVPDTATVPAGTVTFSVNNVGPENVHEFVVLKTDSGAGALPVESTGAVSEEGAGITAMGEVEDVPVGEARQLTVDLSTGKYVLLCNIYEDADKVSHYTMGMRTDFAVE